MKHLLTHSLLLVAVLLSSGCTDLDRGGYYDRDYYGRDDYRYNDTYRRNHDYRYQRDPYRHERERLEDERENIERERRRLEAERRQMEERAATSSPPPPGQPAPERCPPGFHPSERKCSKRERRHGCKDMRLPGGRGCVKR